MLWNTDMITIDLMKWFWTIKITDRCQQLIWSPAEQTIHTIYYCIIQRNFKIISWLQLLVYILCPCMFVIVLDYTNTCDLLSTYTVLYPINMQYYFVLIIYTCCNLLCISCIPIQIICAATLGLAFASYLIFPFHSLSKAGFDRF